MIIIIAAVAILVIGGGAYVFLGGSDEVSQEQIDAASSNGEESSAESTDGETAKATGAAKVGSALYVPMPRAFRFNVPGASRDRFVEIKVQLLVRGSDNEEDAKKHVPLIESTLLNVFSLSNADDLSTSAFAANTNTIPSGVKLQLAKPIAKASSSSSSSSSDSSKKSESFFV